jgi:hypothetical protein
MSFQEKLDHLIIDKANIPAAYALKELIHQNTYLSNGEMIEWKGATHEVFSPICIKTDKGVERVKIGSYPICTEKEAMVALDAACVAYNEGRGEWPTMSVAKRIRGIYNGTLSLEMQHLVEDIKSLQGELD